MKGRYLQSHVTCFFGCGFRSPEKVKRISLAHYYFNIGSGVVVFYLITDCASILKEDAFLLGVGKPCAMWFIITPVCALPYFTYFRRERDVPDVTCFLYVNGVSCKMIQNELIKSTTIIFTLHVKAYSHGIFSDDRTLFLRRFFGCASDFSRSEQVLTVAGSHVTVQLSATQSPG